MLSATWARLVGGITASPSPAKGAGQLKEQRLARFKRSYSQLIQLGRRSLASPPEKVDVGQVSSALDRLAIILQEESQTPVPHPCLSLSFSSQLPNTVLKVVRAIPDEAVLRAALSIYSAVISSEDDFLADKSFARCLTALTGLVSGPGAIKVSARTEAAVVELRFRVAAKIRLHPQILPAWFKRLDAADGHSDGAVEDESKPGDAHAGATSKGEFPLFYSLLDHVHYESPIGDFARTGLLYILEAASNLPWLERWVVGSDLATLLASGLGALYSQLSGKLTVAFPHDALPAVLALSDYEEPARASGTQSSASAAFRTHLLTFLSYLVFWQDILEQCSSAEIRRTLLDHFELLFLKQVLYPSLLESSDADGGSSVAALTYLHQTLEALHHPDLTRLTLEYLLAVPKKTADDAAGPISPSAVKRRKTLETIVQSQAVDHEISPALFNLVDLIITSLRSDSSQTVNATLKVAAVLLRKHHPCAGAALQRIASAPDHLPRRTIGGHRKEVGNLLSLALAISNVDGLADTFDNYRADSLNNLQSHSCFSVCPSGQDDPVLKSSFRKHVSGGGGAPQAASSHVIHREDGFLKCLSALFADFLANDVETNLGLTDAIIALASCAYARLEGWLLVEPADYTYEDHVDGDVPGGSVVEDAGPAVPYGSDDVVDFEEEQRLSAMAKAQRLPSWPAASRSPIMASLEDLVAQVSKQRAAVPGFDVLFAQRKLLFQTGDGDAAGPLLLGGPPPQHLPSADQAGQAGDHRGGALDSTAAGHPQPSPPQAGAAAPFSTGPEEEEAAVDGDSLRRRVTVVPALSSGPATAQQLLRGRGGQAQSSSTTATATTAIITAAPGSSENSLEPDSSAGSSDEEYTSRGQRGGGSSCITVNHLLTNAVILQEFILELMALVEVRASLLDDVSFV